MCGEPLTKNRQPVVPRGFGRRQLVVRATGELSHEASHDVAQFALRIHASHSGQAMQPQLTAFFTSAVILASSAAVKLCNAKATGHRPPSSRFAWSLKPNVAYLVLNFCALWKKQTTLPSLLVYAGIPYQVVGERAGALPLMMAWSRLAMARSGSGSSAIFASATLSPSALRAAIFCSWTRSIIAAFSSSVNPSYLFLVAVVVLANFVPRFFADFLSAIGHAVAFLATFPCWRIRMALPKGSRTPMSVP